MNVLQPGDRVIVLFASDSDVTETERNDVAEHLLDILGTDNPITCVYGVAGAVIHRRAPDTDDREPTAPPPMGFGPPATPSTVGKR